MTDEHPDVASLSRRRVIVEADETIAALELLIPKAAMYLDGGQRVAWLKEWLHDVKQVRSGVIQRTGDHR